MGKRKASGSKYQKKLAKRQEKRVSVKESLEAEVAAALATKPDPESLQSRYRQHHKDVFLWNAIPLFRDGKPVVFPKLTAYLPARTRDGRAAYIEEIDPNRSKHQCVTVHITDPGHPGKFIKQDVSINGMFAIDDKPSGMDILNVSPESWNEKFEEGLVGIRADERRVANPNA